jgi:hypothetical protein
MARARRERRRAAPQAARKPAASGRRESLQGAWADLPAQPQAASTQPLPGRGREGGQAGRQEGRRRPGRRSG